MEDYFGEKPPGPTSLGVERQRQLEKAMRKKKGKKKSTYNYNGPRHSKSKKCDHKCVCQHKLVRTTPTSS